MGMPQAVLLSSWGEAEFAEMVDRYAKTGWTLGNLSTAIAGHGWYSGRPRICYSMVVTMSYSPPVTTQNVTQVAAAYAVQAADQYIEATTSGSSYAITLPAATGSGRTLVVKKVTAGQTVTLTPNGTDTIDGAASQAMKQQNSSFSLIDAVAGKWEIF